MADLTLIAIDHGPVPHARFRIADGGGADVRWARDGRVYVTDYRGEAPRSVELCEGDADFGPQVRKLCLEASTGDRYALKRLTLMVSNGIERIRRRDMATA